MNFEESKKKNVACIYRITFPNGKCYVGKTKDLSNRIALYERKITDDTSQGKVIDAFREFGADNVEIDILSEPKNISDKDKDLVLSILEIKYIRLSDCIYPNGYNVSIGGELLGIPCDCTTTDLAVTPYTGGHKPVLVYDLDGNFIQEFDSIEKCAYNFGVDPNVVSLNLDKRREVFYGKYMLRQKRYGKIPEKIIPFKREVVEKKIIKKVYEDKIVYREKIVSAPKNTILKYNENGEFCGEYDTLIDAAISIGRSNIKKGVLIGGYIFFEHDGGEIKQNIGKIEKKVVRLPKYSDALKNIGNSELNFKSKGWSKLINDFNVAQYDLEGNLLKVYDNIKSASYETGISYSCIWACVFGRTKRCKCYVFKKYDI